MNRKIGLLLAGMGIALTPAAVAAQADSHAQAHAHGHAQGHASAPMSNVSAAAPHAHAAAQAGAAHAPVIDRAGKRIGTAAFEQTPNGVLVSVAVEGIPAGEHGFHFHQTGVCDPKTGFSSAGGHFAPGGSSHGFEVAGGPHAGDMPNQFVRDDGVLRAHVFNSKVTLGAGANSLIDADGSALVIHAGADDYSSQPSGDAGDRLACAVVSSGKK